MVTVVEVCFGGGASCNTGAGDGVAALLEFCTGISVKVGVCCVADIVLFTAVLLGGAVVLPKLCVEVAAVADEGCDVSHTGAVGEPPVAVIFTELCAVAIWLGVEKSKAGGLWKAFAVFPLPFTADM